MNVVDLQKLENLVTTADGWQARCPACAEMNEDKNSRNHLGIQHDGKFNCAKYNRDKEHNARVLALAGTEAVEGETPIYTFREPRMEMPQTWNPSILTSLIKDYSYFLTRGISEKTQAFFEMGVAMKGYFDKRVVIPIYNPSRTLIIGFSGRLYNFTKWHKENGVGKWKHKGEVKSFIWPYMPDEIKKTKRVILIESPGCNLYLYENNIKDTICLFGTNISSKIMGYLIGLNPEEILIATNNELASENKGVGNKAAMRIKGQLLQFFDETTIKIALPPTKDFGELNSVADGKKLLDKWRKIWLNK